LVRGQHVDDVPIVLSGYRHEFGQVRFVIKPAYRLSSICRLFVLHVGAGLLCRCESTVQCARRSIFRFTDAESMVPIGDIPQCGFAA